MLKGSKFQIKVWKEIKKIPKGKVTTYKNIAKSIGYPKAFRAVANACGKNPYAPSIPCHRVIKSEPIHLLICKQKVWYRVSVI